MFDEWTCEECDKTNQLKEFPFGDDVTCEFCGAVHETDAEYDWDSLHWWITGRKSQEEKTK